MTFIYFHININIACILNFYFQWSFVSSSFQVKTDKGHLKIKVIKMRDGRIRLGSVEVVKENHILNFC